MNSPPPTPQQSVAGMCGVCLPLPWWSLCATRGRARSLTLHTLLPPTSCLLPTSPFSYWSHPLPSRGGHGGGYQRSQIAGSGPKVSAHVGFNLWCTASWASSGNASAPLAQSASSLLCCLSSLPPSVPPAGGKTWHLSQGLDLHRPVDRI